MKETSTLSPNCHPTDISKSLITETLLSRHQIVVKLKSGTSTKTQRPSRPESTTNHGTSEAQEDPMTCKSGAPTQAGGKYSDMRMNTSSISKTLSVSMYMVERTKNQERSSHGRDTEELTRDGRSFTLTRRPRNPPRVWTQIPVWKETDHSISNQECQ